MTFIKLNSALNQSTFLIAITILLNISCTAKQEDKATGEANNQAPTMTIHEAVFLGKLDIIEEHIKAGTDLNEKDDYGSAPLSIAATFGKTEAAKLLIKGGANLNITSADGSTPLHTASFFCRTEIVKALLEAGADVTSTNNYGATPLASVSAPFNDVKMIYDQIGKDLGPFGLKLDYNHLEETRPVIAQLLSAKQ